VDEQESHVHPDEHHNPPREGSFQDEHGNVKKPAVVADYNCYLDDVDEADRMVSSYSAVEHGGGQRSSFSTY
jgi:hypothetical protein